MSSSQPVITMPIYQMPPEQAMKIIKKAKNKVPERFSINPQEEYDFVLNKILDEKLFK